MGIKTIDFQDTASIRQDAEFSYKTGTQTSVAENDVLHAAKGGFSFRVANSSASDTHITTKGGVKLHALPVNDSFLTPTQFGCIKNGVTDDGANLAACLTYAHRNGYSVHLGVGDIAVGKRATPLWHYNYAVDGARNRLKIRGEGPTMSKLVLKGTLDDFLFKVTGGTTAYGAPHASWIDFEDFGINGNGSDRQDLFSFTCADRVNLRNLQAFNFRGYGVRGREWWDSLCDARFVRGGDDSLGAEKAVIDLDYVFANRIWDSSCNNIIFPETTQIESYRYQAMRMGTATRRVTFRGKIHYWIGKTYTQPAVHILGGVDNRFLGAAMTHAVGSDPRPRDITVENNGWIPARNVFQSSSMGGGIDFIGDCRQHLVKDNVFDNGTTSCIHFDSWGAQNIVKDNIPRGSGPEVTYNNPATLMPQRIHANLRVGPEPADGWSNSALHVYEPSADNALSVECGAVGAFIRFKDPNSAVVERIGVQSGKIRAQKDGANQTGFDG